MKFSEFQTNKNQTNVNKEYEKIRNENPQQAESIEEKLKSYENLSESELMKEFIKESQRLKNNGDLSQDKINNIKSTLTPFLNSDQQKQLDYLLGLVNDDK